MTESGSDSCGDCGWVDYVQSPMPSDWNSISYVYDPGGRRIEKKYDGQAVMKYLYDGDHIIAEYDATGALVHKYIYGPGVDQPICMIDAADANATYYYHFDGLGSVIALTDSAGAVANLYEYSIFGEVSASDPNHPNRFLFTGREFDSETGLYYYRARYYNPYIGRFLQTDPVGYEAGMNLYRYCMNNPLNMEDPYGLCYRAHIELPEANLTITTNWGCWPLTQQFLSGLLGGSKLTKFFPIDINDDNCPPGEHCKWGWTINFDDITVDFNDFTIPGPWIPLAALGLPAALIPSGCTIHLKGSLRLRGWYQSGKCVPDDVNDTDKATSEGSALNGQRYSRSCSG